MSQPRQLRELLRLYFYRHYPNNTYFDNDRRLKLMDLFKGRCYYEATNIVFRCK